MPAQAVLDPRALGTRSSRWSTQQLDLARRLDRVSALGSYRPLAQRCPGDRERVDRVGFAALRAATGEPRHELGSHPHDPLAARRPAAARACRRVAAVLDRPHALGAERPRPAEAAARGPLACELDGQLAQQLAGGRLDRGDGVLGLVWVRLRSRSCAPSLRWMSPTKRTAGGQTSLGAIATLLSSHAGDPRAAAGDTTRCRSVGGRHAVSESARRHPEATGRVGCNRPVTGRVTVTAQYPAGSGVGVSVLLRQPHGFEGFAL